MKKLICLKKISGLVTLIFLLTLLLSGCTFGTKATDSRYSLINDYPIDYDDLVAFPRTPANSKTIKIRPIEDVRPQNPVNREWLILVPFIPWVDVIRNRPYSSSALKNDFKDAVNISVRKSNLFEQIINPYKASEPDFVLEGELQNCGYSLREYSYGLSILFIIPWTFGAPFKTYSFKLKAKLKLKNRRTNQICWSYLIDIHYPALTEIIYSKKLNCDVHDSVAYLDMMQEGMNEAMEDLHKQMRKHPERFE